MPDGMSCMANLTLGKLLIQESLLTRYVPLIQHGSPLNVAYLIGRRHQVLGMSLERTSWDPETIGLEWSK